MLPNGKVNLFEQQVPQKINYLERKQRAKVKM